MDRFIDFVQTFDLDKFEMMQQLNIKLQKHIDRSILIDPWADSPDLATGPCERGKILHNNHGCSEIVEEGSLVADVCIHLSISCSIVEEFLIRVEQTSLCDQVPVVIVVKYDWASDVQWCKVVVSSGLRAGWSPCGCKCRVYVGIVVDSGSECCAPCLSYCMRACMYMINVLDQLTIY